MPSHLTPDASSLSLTCPACGQAHGVLGHLTAEESEYRVTPSFYPEKLRFALFRRSVPLAKGMSFAACPTCGCVWAHVDPAALQTLLLQRATPPHPWVRRTVAAGKLLVLAAVLALAGFVLAHKLGWLG
ncbi:MAG: hypothetical protein RLZZ618_2428 [Pseudomonadota bacterium]|jgi:predicted RNA-binding Zn-ribbon protein involved in translation (DUF1610 family)